FPWRTLEPAARFQFAREPAPQTAVIVQRAVAKAADTITIGLRRRLAPLQQRHERLLQNILRFAVAEPQRPAVENQLRGFRFVKGFAPICLGTHISSLNRHPSGRICIKNLARNRLFSRLDCTTPRYSAALWNRQSSSSSFSCSSSIAPFPITRTRTTTRTRDSGGDELDRYSECSSRAGRCWCR